MNNKTKEFRKEFADIKGDIMKRDRLRCQIEGVKHSGSLDVDHIIKRSLGGKNDPENLITLCRGCHQNYEIMNPYQKVRELRVLLKLSQGYKYNDRYTRWG